MTYQETLNYLFSQLPMYQRIGGAAYQADLSTTQKLDEYFNHPTRGLSRYTLQVPMEKDRFRICWHRFSKCRFQNRTLYISHILDFRERIKINGQMIPENEVVEWVEQHKAILTKLSPSF